MEGENKMTGRIRQPISMLGVSDTVEDSYEKVYSEHGRYLCMYTLYAMMHMADDRRSMDSNKKWKEFTTDQYNGVERSLKLPGTTLDYNFRLNQQYLVGENGDFVIYFNNGYLIMENNVYSGYVENQRHDTVTLHCWYYNTVTKQYYILKGFNFDKDDKLVLYKINSGTNSGRIQENRETCNYDHDKLIIDYYIDNLPDWFEQELQFGNIWLVNVEIKYVDNDEMGEHFTDISLTYKNKNRIPTWGSYESYYIDGEQVKKKDTYNLKFDDDGFQIHGDLNDTSLDIYHQWNINPHYILIDGLYEISDDRSYDLYIY